MKDFGLDTSCPQFGTGANEESFVDVAISIPKGEENFRVNRVTTQDIARERAADLIRAAFPGATDRETARSAAAFLGVSDRQVINWLNLEHSMAFEHVFAVGCRVGVFPLMQIMTRDQTRRSVLGKIIQGARRVVG